MPSKKSNQKSRKIPKLRKNVVSDRLMKMKICPKDHVFKQRIGSKAQVYHCTAKQTSGGLQQKDLMQNDRKRICSIKQHKHGVKALKYLLQNGFIAQKGSFVPGKKMLQLSNGVKTSKKRKPLRKNLPANARPATGKRKPLRKNVPVNARHVNARPVTGKQSNSIKNLRKKCKR
jgi:hypothetical protein